MPSNLIVNLKNLFCMEKLNIPCSCDYRLCKIKRKYKDVEYDTFAIHVAYFDKDGNITSISDKPVTFLSDNLGMDNIPDFDPVKIITDEVSFMLKTVQENDIFEVPESWKIDV